MTTLEKEKAAFLRNRSEAAVEARGMVAFLLATGIDLSAALASAPPYRRAVLAKVDRLIERERLKGVRGHWSYDLNRHIALKQARDRLASSD